MVERQGGGSSSLSSLRKALRRPTFPEMLGIEYVVCPGMAKDEPVSSKQAHHIQLQATDTSCAPVPLLFWQDHMRENALKRGILCSKGSCTGDHLLLRFPPRMSFQWGCGDR